jgi:transcriptional regulator with XRE-family HTH domain
MNNEFDIATVRKRLEDALAAKNLTMRNVSEIAKLNPGYVHAIIKDGREPTIGNLAKVCSAAEISLSYVLYGFEMSPQTERLIALIEQHPDKRDGILALLE